MDAVTTPRQGSIKPKICFVAPSAWPVLAGDRSVQTAGGAEVQMTFLAKGLAARGYPVSMVCLDFGQPDGVTVDGVSVRRASVARGGVPGFQLLFRTLSLWQAMARADAHIYYQRCAGSHTGYVAAFCRWRGRRFIFAAASNSDFSSALPLLPLRDQLLYRWGLRHAHAVVAQNPSQIENCRALFGIEPVLLPSAHLLPPAARQGRAEGYVLWVSSFQPLKQPGQFLELARRLPQFTFRMVGGAGTNGGDFTRPSGRRPSTFQTLNSWASFHSRRLRPSSTGHACS